MKNVVAVMAGIGVGVAGILVAFGNDLGLLGLIPAGILVLTDMKKV
jgi:hypothetical protein